MKYTELIPGKIYHAQAKGEPYYWLLNIAKIQSNGNIFTNGSITNSRDCYATLGACFTDRGQDYKYQEANDFEKRWLETCTKAGKFIPKQEII